MIAFRMERPTWTTHPEDEKSLTVNVCQLVVLVLQDLPPTPDTSHLLSIRSQ